MIDGNDTDGKAVTPYYTQINEIAAGFDGMQAEADALVVDSDESQGQANEMIAQAKKLSRAIEDRRVKIYDELYPKANRKVMKEVNERAKLYKGRLVTMNCSLEGKFLSYRDEKRRAEVKAEAERIAKEEAERKAAEAEREAKMAHIPPEMREDVAPVVVESTPTVQKPVTNMVQGHTGNSYTKKEKYFVMVDFSKVPDGYKTLDEVRVRKAMRDGIEIPGIEYKTRDKLATRLK
jgi:hypothetical protein